jgi:hypothetical protein
VIIAGKKPGQYGGRLDEAINSDQDEICERNRTLKSDG